MRLSKHGRTRNGHIKRRELMQERLSVIRRVRRPLSRLSVSHGRNTVPLSNKRHQRGRPRRLRVSLNRVQHRLTIWFRHKIVLALQKHALLAERK
jgi:hypothetical protein